MDQALAFLMAERGVKHQLTGALDVIADQCPGVQAQSRRRQMQVIDSVFRQGFKQAA